MLKFLCFCLVGVALGSSWHGRPAPLNKYYGAWPAHWRPYAPPQGLFTLNEHRPKHGSAPQSYNYQRRIPEAKNHYQPYQGIEKPRLSVELDLSIKPYFNRAHNDASRGSQGSPKTPTQFGQRVNDSVDDNTRPKRKPAVSLVSSIGALTLQLRIEDVNQIWGYAGPAITESPVEANKQTQNEANGVTETPNSTREDNTETTKETNDVTPYLEQSTSRSTESSTAGTSFDIDKWLASVIENGPSNSADLSSGGSPFQQPLTNDTGSGNHNDGSNGMEQDMSIDNTSDKSYLQYGSTEFDEWLEKQLKIAQAKEAKITESATQQINKEDVHNLGPSASHTDGTSFDIEINKNKPSTHVYSETETVKPLTTSSYELNGTNHSKSEDDDAWIQSIFKVPDDATTPYAYYDESGQIQFPGPKQTDVDERFGNMEESKRVETTTRLDEESESDLVIFTD